MASSIEKKYRETLESIFSELMPADETDGHLKTLLQPLRIYTGDIGRFHTRQIFVAKLRKFLEARDRIAVLPFEMEKNRILEKARGYQTEVNHSLNLVLQSLDEDMAKRQNLGEALEEVTTKLEEAKSINSVQALRKVVQEAGRSVAHEYCRVQEVLTHLTAELNRCRDQIDDLELEFQEAGATTEEDPLTQLRNAEGFDRDLGEAVDRAHHFNNPLCLFLIHLDNLTRVHETHGNRVGDEVVVNFASLLQRALRDFDLTYRIGDADFAVLFSGCSLERARLVGERVRSYLSQHPYRVDDATFGVTLSGGLAALKAGEDTPSFFLRAGTLLSEAKQTGRNCVLTQ